MRVRDLAGVVFGFVAVACGPDPNGGGTNTPGWNTNDGPRQDGGPYVQQDSGPPVNPVVLQGTVWGPGHVFPVAGALVAAYGSPPAPIPDHIYCDICADPGVAHTFSAADGTFELAVNPGFTYYLVVQKGQFRRVRQWTAPPGGGTFTVPDEYTTLPSRTDPANGDTIPRIALGTGSFDKMETIFGKVGMGRVDTEGNFIWGSEQGVFDVFNNGGEGGTEDFGDLLRDYDRLRSYHIVFMPCSHTSNAAFEDEVQENIRNYVAEGGKWYVADWSEEYIENIWPEFLHLGDCYDESDCNSGTEYDSDGAVAVDQQLADWLSAQGVNTFTAREAWDYIIDMAQGFVGYDEELGTGPNHEVYMLPKVWVEGPVPNESGKHPLTVSWPYLCGRVIYTVYHSVGEMSGPHPDLYPQEKILFYLVMEIGLCQDQPVVE